MTYFNLTESASHGYPLVRAEGELDMACAPKLRASLDKLIDQGERRLVLDLTDATFIDSTMIGTLMSALRRVRADGGSIEIVCTTPNILMIFEYAGLNREFRFHDSLDHVGRPAPSPVT